MLTGWVTPRRTVALVLAWAAFQGLFVWAGSQSPPNAGGPPDFLVFASVDELRACLEALTEAGRAAYVRTCAIDMVYPLVYGGLLVAVLALLSRTSRLLWLPVVAVVFDYVENVGFLRAMATWPEPSNTVLSIATVANSVKWSAAAAALFAIVALGVRRLVTRTAQ